nr:unnamed protein product [Digitaria exilis]
MQPETTKKPAGGLTSPVDRLSALPDALLHAILSFVPAPQVVQTCLLSQRWRHLWRSAPCIKINQQDFGISMRSLMTHAALDEKWARFEDFATNLLLFHDNTSSLDEFLVFAHVYNQRHVDRWIRRGIEYCPAVLRILMPGTDLAFKLPPMASSSFHRLKRFPNEPGTQTLSLAATHSQLLLAARHPSAAALAPELVLLRPALTVAGCRGCT